MDFSFNEAQKAISELSRKIFKERVTPAALKAVEAEPDWFYRKLWEDLATAGLLATALPESEGGSGHGLLELCALLEEAGAAVAPIPLWAVLFLGALPVAEFGTAEQKHRLLPGIGAGEILLTAALTEAGMTDPAAPVTTAIPDGSGWLLTGTKICVPAAHLAHRVLLPARTGEGSVGVFLLDPHTPGVRRERQIATTGEPLSQLTFSGARVAEADVLGDPHQGAAIVDWIVQRATVGLCALELGVAERALAMTASYTGSRMQFERPIATFQAVGQRAADAYIDVEAIRLSLWQAAFRLSQGLPASQSIAIAKFWAAEGGHRVVYAAQHLHGGLGFDRDYPLHRHYLWSKQIELTLGSAEAQLARLGAELAGQGPEPTRGLPPSTTVQRT
ncbi:MAG: acyl-CoA dehydrogenase family protein [Minicystis sp.]